MPTIAVVQPAFDPALGYSMDLSSWTEVESEVAGARRFVDPSTDSTLVMAFDVAERTAVTICGPGTGVGIDCDRVDLPNPWMIHRDDRLAWLRERIEAAAGPCDPGCSMSHRASAIGGDPAGRVDVERKGRHFQSMFAVRGSTPVILTMNEPAAADGHPVVDRLLRLSLGVDFTQIADVPALRTAADITYVDPMGRFAFDVPWPWSIWRGPTPEHPDRMIGFVASDSRWTSVFELYVGRPDGSVEVCATRCASGVADSLEDLDDLVVSKPEGTSTRELHDDAALGGEPARTERHTTGIIWGPDLREATYAIRDGRPYVLVFDHWNLRDRPTVLKSFQFLD